MGRASRAQPPAVAPRQDFFVSGNAPGAAANRMPFLTNHQTAAISVGDNLVNGVVTVGGFTNRCSQRTSATAPFRIGYSFNATPGGGTAAVGDGKPYITEICDERDFAFIEIFVP